MDEEAESILTWDGPEEVRKQVSFSYPPAPGLRSQAKDAPNTAFVPRWRLPALLPTPRYGAFGLTLGDGHLDGGFLRASSVADAADVFPGVSGRDLQDSQEGPMDLGRKQRCGLP